MTSPKTKFTLWRIIQFAVFASILCLAGLAGCGGREVQLGFPLEHGNSWTYQGTTEYRFGNNVQTMPQLTFRLTSRQVINKPETPYILELFEETTPLWSVQFVKSAKGLVNPLTGELWIPTDIRIGKRWSCTVDQNKVTMILRQQTSTTVPAGTFSTYFINFKGPKSDYGSLWLDPDVGIIALNWTSKTAGGRSNTRLELTSYQFP